jgi:hypothetical protein
MTALSSALLLRRKFIAKLGMSLVILSLCLGLACKSKIPPENKASLLQACPEEWIQNKMPGSQSEYFIYKSERHELKEFDLKWIEKNCQIKPQIVQ